jgi:hypothetical protein
MDVVTELPSSRPATSHPRIAQTPAKEITISATPMCMPVCISTRLAARQTIPIQISLMGSCRLVAGRPASGSPGNQRKLHGGAAAPTITAA